MALKSSREGLRKELVDYLGNIIIDDNLKQNIINSVGDVFINSEELTTSVNELDEKISNESLARERADVTLQENINAEITARQVAITNIEDLINNGTLKKDFLWTNASPTSAFSGQNINLDLSRYKQIIIVFKIATDINIECSNLFNVSSNFSITSIYQSYSNSVGTIAAFREIVYVSADSVHFGNGKKVISLNSYIDDSTLMIPYQIYGVR